MDYREMSIKLLRSENPQELDRLKSEEILDEVMQEVQRAGEEQEELLIRQMAADLPKNLPYQERVQALNNARLVAQEIVVKETTEFWRSVEEAEHPLLSGFSLL